MGRQVLLQPDGGLAVFSTSSDTIVLYDATGDEVVDYFVELAAEDTRREVGRVLGHVLAGEPRRAYFQFAYSWDTVLQLDREHGGEAWRRFICETCDAPATDSVAGAHLCAGCKAEFLKWRAARREDGAG